VPFPTAKDPIRSVPTNRSERRSVEKAAGLVARHIHDDDLIEERWAESKRMAFLGFSALVSMTVIGACTVSVTATVSVAVCVDPPHPARATNTAAAVPRCRLGWFTTFKYRHE
jgi:hypothetical protein